MSPLIFSLNMAPVDLNKKFTPSDHHIMTHDVAMMARRWSNWTSPVLGPSILSKVSFEEEMSVLAGPWSTERSSMMSLSSVRTEMISPHRRARLVLPGLLL